MLNSDRGIRHSSDDGEPSGTAGKPILDVILGAGLLDVIVIVTRIISEELNLVREGLLEPIQEPRRRSLKNAEIVEVTTAKLFEFVIDYGLLPKLQHLCMELGIIIYGNRISGEGKNSLF